MRYSCCCCVDSVDVVDAMLKLTIAVEGEYVVFQDILFWEFKVSKLLWVI